jgi:acyl-CoA thioesterase-2
MGGTTALDELIALLDLERIEVNLFRGAQSHDDRQRVFGGQVAGQALVAAARTIDEPDRFVHSLHAYFLRPGDPNVPIVYEVDRIRDGKSFSTRRVVAVQHGRPIFNLQTSFHRPEPGLDFEIALPLDVPPPESLPGHQERLAAHRERLGDWYDRPRPIDLRYVPPEPVLQPGVKSERQLVWMRADGVLPDDPVLHACIVTYASDMTLLDTALRPFGKSWLTDELMGASLDHAMWFHRPFKADEWLLYDQHAISASSARGLAQGSIFTSDGHLAVNVVQEGLIRVLT